jgi:hypothetical protein
MKPIISSVFILSDSIEQTVQYFVERTLCKEYYCILYFFMSGAIEKQKLVYILNRDAEARLTISSPLEAHKSNTLVYHTVGVDAGFENPMFACLEIDYEVNVNCKLLL